MLRNKKLLLIFLLAFILRVAWLGNLPSGFHNDEVDVGYVGKFMLLNGRDPAGNFLPLTFNKFGDFRPAGLFYIAGLSQLIFGTNVFAARLPTAFFGALSVWPIFYLAREIFKSSRLETNESSLPLTSHSRESGNQFQGRLRGSFDKLRILSGFSIESRMTAARINSKQAGLNNFMAYSAAFFLAILPWHIVLSRAGHEAIVGYFFVL